MTNHTVSVRSNELFDSLQLVLCDRCTNRDPCVQFLAQQVALLNPELEVHSVFTENVAYSSSLIFGKWFPAFIDPEWLSDRKEILAR